MIILLYFKISLLSDINEELPSSLPISFSLSQNYPNPFNPRTSIEIDLSAKSSVKLEIFDILGRLVDTPINQNLTAGTKASIGIRIPNEVVFYGDVVWSAKAPVGDVLGYKIGFSIQMLSLDGAIQTDESKTNEIIQLMVDRHRAQAEFEEYPSRVD